MLGQGVGQPRQQRGERSQWGDGGVATWQGPVGVSGEQQWRGLKHGGMKPSRSSRGLEGEAARGMTVGLARTRRETGDEGVGV